ncbi:V-set and transmembrane domain-containing protein 4 [Spea bombifrons]|uniref:V-set and transmembrane domain-containing protein 4 n=1 Tax=Spea bombifrons TaxID=233779 RepID=UPI00234A3182|nr:V-set and transmembrane domain-containing protein 4 [Spea bombifrons]
MTLCIPKFVFFSQTIIAGLCYTLNVTISPSPWVLHPVGENASLWCSVTQKRRKDSLLTARWIFSPDSGHEQIIGRITKFGTAHIAANWSHRGDMSTDSTDKGYHFLLLLIDLRPSDQGHYTCRIQEVTRYRSRWIAVSNGTAVTQLRVTSLTISEEKKLFTWNLFQDVYVYAVLLCCVGILSIMTFLLILLCQGIYHMRHSKVKWKSSQERSCGQNPSSMDLWSVQHHKKKRADDQEAPPAIPVKSPLISVTKNPQQFPLLPQLVEEGLAYAELELMKSPVPVKDPKSTTVYAQILFEESSLGQENRPAEERITTESPNVTFDPRGPRVHSFYNTGW